MVTAIVTIVIFLVLISFHEFGHFIMSKAVGVKVLEFAVGMGPAIFKRQGKETLYSVRILPIGGYCKLEGEDEETDDARAFCNQKLWKRFLVIVAGAVINLILGFIIFIIMIAGQDGIYTREIAQIDTRSALYGTAAQVGDEIVAINGKKIHLYNDIALYSQDFSADQDITLTLKNGNEKKTVTIKPQVMEERYQYQEDGVRIFTTMNGETQESFLAYGPEDKALVADRIGKEYTGSSLKIGYTPVMEDVTLWNIIPEAYHNTGFVVRLVYNALWDLIRGQGSVDDLSGPVGIVSVVDTAVKSDTNNVLQVLNIMALLTINLGIFNLLPLPALDGGRLFFMLIEFIRGKPVPAEKEGMVHAIGLLLLLAFAVLISFNDIMKLLGR